jgi:hypothetical protein
VGQAEAPGNALSAAELVVEFPVGCAHFAAKILAGLAQLALGVAAGAAHFFPGFPSRMAEVVPKLARFGPVAVMIVVPAPGGSQAKDDGDSYKRCERLHDSLV